MSWLKKYLPGGSNGNNSSPSSFIMGSDKWMGSTTQHQGEKADPAIAQPPIPEQDDEDDDQQEPQPSNNPEIARSTSFTHAPTSTPTKEDMARSHSMTPTKITYPEVHRPPPSTTSPPPSSPSLYPKIYEGKDEAEDEEETEEEEEDAAVPLNPREECLVTLPAAIVYLVDAEQSVHLATGHLSIVRIAQKGNGIVVLVRVGESLHWPLGKDVPTVRLDPTHYSFALPVPATLSGSGNFEAEVDGSGIETLNYGVTFPDAKKHEQELKKLDEILALYSSFSSPTLIQGDEQKEALTKRIQELSTNEKGQVPSQEVVDLDNNHGGKVVPAVVLSSEGKQVVATEENQVEFWTTMAPDVNDYGSSAARAIATGSGQVIRGIFWVRDSTVTSLESGTMYMKSKITAGEKPRPIGPTTLKNLKRVRNLSRATENLAKGVLKGIVTTAGFFSGSVIRSRAGKKVFKLMPGEVALVSLDAIAMLFDAMEKATTDVLQSTSLMTQNVVAHKFGEDAAQVTQETLATAGHVVATAWTITKLRKALNPKQGVKPTKTGLVKGFAKNVIKGK